MSQLSSSFTSRTVPASAASIPYQGELPPPLPLPGLQQTLQRYLRAIEAVVPKEKYQKTKEIVTKFGQDGGEGEFLQKKLMEIAATKDNWVYDWWLDDMYLKNRQALPINSNPGMVFPNQNFTCMEDLLRLATHFVNGILDYKILLERQGVPLDKCKGQPMCMAQYYRLLSTCRIPGPGKDIHFCKEDNGQGPNQHILVIYKGRFYSVDVIVSNEKQSESTILASLKRVIAMGDNEAPVDISDSVGILTADQRDRWAKTRSKMTMDATNKDILNTVDRSLFVICIDHPLPVSTFNHRLNYDLTQKKIRDDVNRAIQMLYGGGSKFNSGNRWFDQVLQIILCTDGTCGLCYEHSPAEGIVVIQLMEKLLQSFEKATNRISSSVTAVDSESNVIAHTRKLTWKLNKEIKESIQKAIHNLDKSGEDLDFYVLRFRHYGRDFPKNNNCSPDAFIQLALQLTFYKVHRKLVSTYESAGTRRFRLGRVDNIRASTPEALRWVRAMCGDDVATDSQKMDLFRDAIDVQTEIMTYNIQGQGIDCHLLGLRELAADLGRPLPDIFQDESYKISMHFSLSTSQVPTVTDSFMGYGPVVPNGYGASYNPHANDIVFCISSFYSDDDTNSEMFAMSLESTLLQMKEMIEKAKNAQELQRNQMENGGTTA